MKAWPPTDEANGMAKLQSRREVMHICNPSLLECKWLVLLPRRWRGNMGVRKRLVLPYAITSIDGEFPSTQP
jgi:hypothetical protein